MVTSTTALLLIRDYVARCRQRNIDFTKVILFGSTAKGTATEHSDVDVLLVSDRFTHDSLYNWRLLAPVTAQLSDVEPHPYPPDLFAKKDPFIQEIERTGIDLTADLVA